jgi:hypothetical protein
MTLFHFSEDPTITRFVPRAPLAHPDQPPRVWAIDAEHAALYYFPRDCPRVAFWALPRSAPEDVTRFLGYTTARWVIAIESGWLNRLRSTRLFVYHFPDDSFSTIGDEDRFYTSVETVVPTTVEPVGDLLARLVTADVELRLTPSLWPLYRAIIASTLDFSIIRMRNARPEGSSRLASAAELGASGD